MSLAAFFDGVEERHRCPAPLAAPLALLRPIRLVGIEPVAMGLELLPRQVALPLNGLAIVGRHAE